MRALNLTSILFTFLIAAPFSLASTPEAQQEVIQEPVTAIIGFQQWKKSRVDAAKSALESYQAPKAEKVQAQLNEGEAHSGDESPQETLDQVEKTVEKAVQDPKSQVVKKEAGEILRQLEFNLEIAHGLTIHDYFALYLKDKTQEEISRAVKELSADEVTELLSAYREQLYGAPKAKKPSPKKL